MQLNRDTIVQQYLSMREAARVAHSQGNDQEGAMRQYSAAADYLVGQLYELARQTMAPRFAGAQLPAVVIAVGGYGRHEMAPESDLDLHFISDATDGAYNEALVETVLYPLWDLKLTVGYAVRTLPDAIASARGDLSIWTTLLDHRYLAGDSAYFRTVAQTLRRSLYGPQSKNQVRLKWKELDERRAKQGSTVFLLEPNVKEAMGGLRDLHTLEWSLRALTEASQIDWLAEFQNLSGFSPDEMIELRVAQAFLWKLRAEVHLSSGKKNDILRLHLQDQVAAGMRIATSKTATRSENLMGQYFRHARMIANVTDEMRSHFEKVASHRRALYMLTRRTVEGYFHASGGELSFRMDVHPAQKPELMIRALRIAAESGQRLAYAAARSIDRLAVPARRALFRTSEMRAELLRVFESPHCGLILEQMHRHALLPMLLREFQHLWCRMQHDAYHSYTTDVHLINCVKALDDLCREVPTDWPQGFRDALAAVHDLQLVRLAVFLHDVGKGYGKDHSEFGAELCISIGRRLNYDEGKTRRLALLTRIHLALSDTAQKADINDPAVVRRFCEDVGDVENLHMLYVLTVCDQSGVSRSLLTPWKMKLLDRLYLNALRMLSTGDTRGRWLDSELLARRKRIADIVGAHPELYSSRVLQLGKQYYQSTSDELMVEHAAFLHESEQDSSLAAVRLVSGAESGLFSIWVTGRDVRGVFVRLCGALFNYHLNIMQTEAYVPAQDGFLFNIFVVKAADEYFLEDARKVDRVRRELLNVLNGAEVAVDSSQRDTAYLQTLATVSSRSDLIRWDNDLSQDATVVEVQTWDRLGLLYDVTKVLYEADFTIVAAKIETRGGRVSDAFHVKSADGYKCLDFDKLDGVVAGIRAALHIATAGDQPRPVSGS